MCTLTFVTTAKGFILTSSRDEHKARPTLAPAAYTFQNQTLTFPKDDLAGGTWIAANKDHKIACLLNGAFVKHKHQPPYRKSRGLILLESFTYPTADVFINDVDLHNIEPFTLVLIDQQNKLEINELRWDGAQRHHQKYDATQNHIWSSASLYTPQLQQQRRDWFANWLTAHQQQQDKDILQFHTQKHGSDTENDVVMARNNGLQTVSVTQILAEEPIWRMLYLDLLANSKTITPLNQG